MVAELILFTISVLPVFLIGLYIYNKDKEKESAKLLLKLFLGGMASCILTLVISLILNVIPIFRADENDLNLIELAIKVFIGIALVEEFSKWLMAYLVSYNDKEFDEFYDMILYCVFVALGFACFENLLYVYQSGVGTGIIRALSSVPSHACDGIIMGYYLGLSKINQINNRKDLKIKNIMLSIIIPTITHGIYDFCLFSKINILMIVFYVFVIFLYVYVIKKVNKISKINRKIKYNDNYCPTCGSIVESNYCPICGRKNE